MTLKILDMKKVIANGSKTLGITLLDNLEFSGYDRINYDDFIDFMAFKRLKGKADYNIRDVNSAKKILDALDMELRDCDIFYYKTDEPLSRVPLIITPTSEYDDAFTKFAILIAPKIE